MPAVESTGLRSLLAALGLMACAAAGEADVTVTEVTARSTSGARATVSYVVAVLPRAGWQPEEVNHAIEQARSVFSQCGVTVNARAVYWLDAPPAFDVLDGAGQRSILAALAEDRPIAVFVNQTLAGDTAYSYLRSAPLVSRGTAWITRRSDPQCAGALLAHELGHILLDTPRHSSDRTNLMSHTCTHSNLAGSSVATALSEAQCDRLQAQAATW